MIFLLLSIIASSLIFVIFKAFHNYNINTLQAIVINYGIAGVTGLVNYNTPVSFHHIISEKWFVGAACLGLLFISLFNVMALTAQRNGLSVASVASKMSVVIPVIFGLYVYKEHLSILKGIAIVLALAAVYLTSQKTPQKNAPKSSKSLLWPGILFLGSGVLDTTLKYLETTYVSPNEIPIFSSTLFFSAACIGCCIIVVKAFKYKFVLHLKTVVGGCILGVVNYYSIYLLLKALQYEGFESSTLFTINNVAIVMLSTLLGLLLFKERLDSKNWIGIGIAILSIVLIAIA